MKEGKSRRSRRRGICAVVGVIVGLAGAGGVGAAQAGALVERQTEVYRTAPTAGGPMELRMDLYRVPSAPLKGAVVLIHGGSFVTGERQLEENRVYGEALAARGYLAAAISYRLLDDGPRVRGWASRYAAMVGEHPDPRIAGAISQFGDEFPVAVAAAGEDVVAAVTWLRGRARELGFDPADIALFGASAGAITALTVAYAMEAYGESLLPVAGVIDLRGLLLASPGAANPLSSKGPPLLLLHGEADDRAPISDAEHVFRLAREAGIPVEFHSAPGFGHELGGATLLRLRLDRNRTVLDRLDAFLEESFAGRPASRSLRGRLRGPYDDGPEAQEVGRGRVPPHDLTTFRRALADAALRLVESARADTGFIPGLYGLSKVSRLTYDLDDPARLDWSYWPRERSGLALRQMSAEQRTRTQDIIATLLSSRGYLKVNHIMLLENVLEATETRGFVRDADGYSVSVFGPPGPDGLWGLRFEGHHVSLNVTATPEAISVTPSFLGASPAPVQAGPRAGFHPLRYEQRYAFDLLGMLDPVQRVAAVVSPEPFAEILTTQFLVDPAEWERWPERLTRDGISASTFDAPQRAALLRLLSEIATTYADEISVGWLAAIDLDAVSFAWMGGTRPGDPHYYRIQGTDFVFELDAVQDGGTHVHTVWRDRATDFGGDPLLDHRATHAH